MTDMSLEALLDRPLRVVAPGETRPTLDVAAALAAVLNSSVGEAGRKDRVQCPGCGVQLTVAALRQTHVCGRGRGRPRATEAQQELSRARAMATAVEAHMRRMAQHKE